MGLELEGGHDDCECEKGGQGAEGRMSGRMLALHTSVESGDDDLSAVAR